MLDVAEQFLEQHTIWEWHVTTSGKEFRSMLPGVIDAMKALSKRQPRFKLLSGLSKEEYYTELATCKIQFNSALQDYVSWTVIEATAFGADIVYPNFRSFPEFIDYDRLYKAFDVTSALRLLQHTIETQRTHYDIVDISDLGRQLEAYIIVNDITQEHNIWHETAYCKHLIQGT